MRAPRNYLKDKDLLQLAAEADDVVSLCYEVSRRYGIELTLEQGQKLVDRCDVICIDHPSCLLDEDGYCSECEKPFEEGA